MLKYKERIATSFFFLFKTTAMKIIKNYVKEGEKTCIFTNSY